MEKKKKKYRVLLNGSLCMNSFAVSPEKAINNVRYNLFRTCGSWVNVPAFNEFDVVEE